MDSSIGINIKKDLDKVSKRIKIPAIRNNRHLDVLDLYDLDKICCGSHSENYNHEKRFFKQKFYNSQDDEKCCNNMSDMIADDMCMIKNFLCKHKKTIIEATAAVMIIAMVPAIIKRMID